MKRLEVRVGLFVLIGLVLLGALMLQFSKGVSFFRPTYRVYLKSQDVGGLRERAGVLMSGVQVGTVESIRLAPGGTNVTITLKIYEDVLIYEGSRFVLEQSGFLGDQYVAVQPAEHPGTALADGATAETEEPFNLQQAARSASALVKRLDDTAKRLNDAITDIHELLLNEQTLTNMAVTVANLRSVSERALAAVGRVDRLVDTNSPAISLAGSNLVLFSEQLNTAGGRINALVDTNADEVTRAIKNLEDSTERLNQLMRDVQAGKGLAGTLVADVQVAADVQALTHNLSITSSNLNRLGLWGILWKKKEPKERPKAPGGQLQTPKASTR